MKKLSIIVLVMVFGLVFSPAAYANGFGIKGGVNFATISNLEDEGYDFKSKAGLILGAFYSFDLGDSFTLQPEVYYSMKGTKASGEESGIDFSVKYNLDYIEIPVLLKFKITAGEKVIPSLFAGPYGAFKLKAKVKAEALGQVVEEDLDEYIRDTDFGITVGGALDLKVGSGSIIIDARYSFGLSKIAKEGDSDAKNAAFTVMMGYAFN